MILHDLSNKAAYPLVHVWVSSNKICLYTQALAVMPGDVIKFKGEHIKVLKSKPEPVSIHRDETETRTFCTEDTMFYTLTVDKPVPEIKLIPRGITGLSTYRVPVSIGYM